MELDIAIVFCVNQDLCFFSLINVCRRRLYLIVCSLGIKEETKYLLPSSFSISKDCDIIILRIPKKAILFCLYYLG